jgi:hypothetical protein
LIEAVDIRRRTARLLRKRTGDKTSILFVFDSPANIAGTALLIVDHDAPSKDDERWLYLPSMRKTRRIAPGERGELFFGTDFTYDEIRNEGRLHTSEYTLVGRARHRDARAPSAGHEDLVLSRIYTPSSRVWTRRGLLELPCSMPATNS